MELGINYWAVLVAGASSLAVGFLWYGLIFRDEWIRLMGFTPDSMKNMKMTPNQAYLLQFLASLVMACVLAKILFFKSLYLNLEGPMLGMMVGFWAWLGFVAPVTIGSVLWEGKSWKLWYINASNYLVTLVVMGAILSLWK